MKPSFALDFRDNAVALLHRTARGWMSVGQTTFDSPNLEEALSFLRSTAMGLSPGGVATKLIIPNDQVLYISVHAPGPDAAKRRKQIAVALKGQTPYEVEDLIFDWWGKGDEVNVAVIAKETLAEAESFAHAHRFNPLAFVAVPDNATFQGEPWFGQTSIAEDILAKGEKVDRDQDPVRIIGHDTVPVAQVARDFGDSLAQTVPESEIAPVAEKTAEPEPKEEPAAVAKIDHISNPNAQPEPDVLAPGVEPIATLKDAFPDREIVSKSAPEVEPEAVVEPVKKTAEKTAPDSKPLDAAPDLIATAEVEAKIAPAEAEEAPMALDVDDGLSELRDSAQVPEPAAQPPRATTEKDPVGSQGFSLLRAFASRRKSPSAPPPLKAEPKIAALQPALTPEPSLAASLSPPIASVPVFSPAHLRASVINPVIEPIPDKPRASAPELSGMAVIGAAGETARSGGGTSARMTAERPALARPLPGAKTGTARSARGLKSFGAFVTAPNPAGAKRPRVEIPPKVQSAIPTANPSGVSPARPAKRPIGLGGKPVDQHGKPRYLGLILTCILLVLLALAAAWSTIFLAGDSAVATGTAVATIDQPIDDDIPAPEDEMLADLQDPADFILSEQAEQVADLPVADLPIADLTLDDPVVADLVVTEEEVLEAAPQTGLVSVTGTTTVTPAGDAQDEIFLAAIDTPPAPPDPSALGQPAALSDALPAPTLPPPPFGTVYQFDADGRIIPTPDGIASPEGILLFAGKPPVVPTSRSAVVEAAVVAALSATSEPEAAAPADPGNPSTVLSEPAAPTQIFADPALQGFRPLPRPATLQVPTQGGALDDPALAPNSESRFASLRPQQRPAYIVEAAAPAPTEPIVDQQAIEIAVQTASLVTNGQVLPQTLSPLIVSVSRIPATRPASLVRNAVAAAKTPTIQEPTANKANATAPEADDEPEHNGAMPSLPTSASVAKQATVANAINLSKVSLIGVYGSDGRRYAYVRLTSGKLVKVKVGDKLDGGKVAAITTSVLTYQKGGRAVTLEMPRT
jgi:type IV pilus biogenesis protein PilP